MLFLVLLTSTFFIFRNSILSWGVQKVCEKFNHKYQGKLQIATIRFTGLSGIVANNLCVTSPQKDTLLTLQQFKAHVRLLPLLWGSVRIHDVYINHTDVMVYKTKQRDNFSFLLKKKEKQEPVNNEKSTNNIDLGYFSYNLISSLFDAIPEKIELYNSTLAFYQDTAYVKSTIDTLVFSEGAFKGQLKTSESKGKSLYLINGNINSSSRTLSFYMISKSDSSKTTFPALKSFFNLGFTFDTLRLTLKSTIYEQNALTLQGNAYIKNSRLNHWRISPRNIILPHVEADFSLQVGAAAVQLDSNSQIYVQNIRIKPYIEYTHKPSKKLDFRVTIPEMPSTIFFESLPSGLFSSVEGIKTQGSLGFQMNFSMDTQKPDSVLFNCKMPKHHFKIISYGATRLSILNEEFLYTAYEKGVPVKSFMVGPSNPKYTPLNAISPWLQHAIMTSEDGNFYSHNGFNENAFRKSIAENYKKGRFARGGSTISMQLVKNVFLTRNKTIARKAEEALLVWLIESNRIVSKERMFEVYLNIIEWGPGIYGIGEASEYYFKKKPEALTLAESIYLAMIVPRPKWFKYNFDETGKLKPHVSDFYRIIADHLLRKEIISEEQKESLVPEVTITGAAKNVFLKNDTIPPDSLSLPALDFNFSP